MAGTVLHSYEHILLAMPPVLSQVSCRFCVECDFSVERLTEKEGWQVPHHIAENTKS